MNKYKEAKIEYNRLLSERNSNLLEEVEKTKSEIKAKSSESYRKAKKLEKEINEAPCSVCNKSEFVLKYRDVNGKIDGGMSGSFSLFGGSISGYIHGDISTAPVLSCRNCENERKIVIEDWQTEEKVWYRNLPTIFKDSSFTNYQASDWLKEKGVEVALIIDSKHFHDYSSNNLSNFSYAELETVGLVKKFPEPVKPKWYQFII